jgi:S1-C subfamily serine protease
MPWGHRTGPRPRTRAGLRAGGDGGLEVIGQVLKLVGNFLGRKPALPAQPRGFLGITLTDGKEGPVVQSVLEGAPAAKAGVKVGDRISHFQGRTVVDADDVYRFAGRLASGVAVKLTVVRAGKDKEIAFNTGEGF